VGEAGVRALPEVLGMPFRPLVNAWRVSIQARVVLSTLLLSAVILSLTAWLMLSRINDGLVESKRDASLAQAEAAISEVQEDLDAAGTSGEAATDQLIIQLVDNLAARSGSPPAYVVVLSGPVDTTDASSGVQRQSVAVSADSVPTELRERVRDTLGTWWTYTTVDFAEPDAVDSAGFAVGSRVQTQERDEYALYFLYSFEEQQRTLGLVARAALVSGLLLVALVAAVAWLVTRQVVTPVRLARRIAERLAAGRLEERMHVRGQDDIARLGLSFNQMAVSLQRQIRQLEELSRLQRRFVSDVSHELRTPLTTVRMAADVLHDARGQFDPATARSAELLQNELDRFEALLSDLLEISRFDAGAARLEIARTDLVELAHQVRDGLLPVAERAGATLRVLPRGRTVVAEVDPRRVERVLRNLVSNAIAHAHTDVIDIEVAGDDHAVAIAVRDRGIGLQPGEATLVFNRFWRSDPARTRTGAGTGLGLAIALEDAELHGGWLQAWGEPGVGSQFRLTLPRRAGDELVHSPIPLVPSRPSAALATAVTAAPGRPT
jgi:two-component system sensor histidine kinase MtrB